MLKKAAPYLSIILFIVALDQWSKWQVIQSLNLGEELIIIRDFFNLKYVQNKGAAFGFGNQYNDVIRILLFKVFTIAACLWLFWLLFKLMSNP